MSERSSSWRWEWRWEYGIELTTADNGTKVNWDQTQYPKSRNDMEIWVASLRNEFKRAGAESVSRARLVRRKQWTKTIVTYEAPEVVS